MPVALMARQAGLGFHALNPDRCPIFDGVTGEPVGPATDAKVEAWRDAVMDKVRVIVEKMGESGTQGRSLGQEIERARDLRRTSWEEDDGGSGPVAGGGAHGGGLPRRRPWQRWHA